MSDFSETWKLVRGRFDDAVKGLSDEQLRYQMHPDTLSIGQMAIHVAGVEVSFMSQLNGEHLDGDLKRLASCATDGVVNDLPFPFTDSEITGERVAWALAEGRRYVAEPIEAAGDDLRARTIKSALGPMIDGTGAFARLAYHPGYHQGQVHMVRSAPSFPTA